MKIGEIASVGSIAGLIAAGVVWYHETDNEPLEEMAPLVQKMATQMDELAAELNEQGEELDELSTDAVINRLGRIYAVKCQSGVVLDEDLQLKLNRLLVKYFEKTGLEFNEPC